MEAIIEDLTFIGYWTGGRLPEITNLHFSSFRYHHPDTHYSLYVDVDYLDVMSSSIDIDPKLNIEIVNFSLNKLVEEYLGFSVAKMEQKRAGKLLRKIIRRLHKEIAPNKTLFSSKNNYHMGVSYPHSSLLFHGFHNFAYRSDIARVLIPMIRSYQAGTLYVDLDFCFHRNIIPLLTGDLATYWWEDDYFCNSAFLFTRNDRTRLHLLNRAMEIDTFWPWELYESTFLRNINSQIFPKRNFDPLWSSEYRITNSKDFFIDSQNTQDIISDYSKRDLYASHWHNNWEVNPTSNSAYSYFYEKYSILK